MSIKILIVDDHRLTREGVRTMLAGEEGITVLGEAGDGRSAVRLARELGPDVILMEVCMPHMNGIVATSLILAEAPRIKVIALSRLDDRRFVFNMLRAGASGYVNKDCSFKDLIQAIRRVAANKNYLSPGIIDLVVKDYAMPSVNAEAPDSANLTIREKEVLQLVAEGYSTPQIAGSLHLSVKTVESHRQSLMGKINAKGIAGLTKYAIREGLTSA